MQDNRKRLEPGPGWWRMKGAEHVARTGVQRPATLTEGKGKGGVAGGESDVVDS
jgi:hypothetical protein